MIHATAWAYLTLMQLALLRQSFKDHESDRVSLAIVRIVMVGQLLALGILL